MIDSHGYATHREIDGASPQITAQKHASFEHTLSAVYSTTLFAGVLLYYFVFQYRFYSGALILILTIHVLLAGRYISNINYSISLFVFFIYQTASSLWSPDYMFGFYQSLLDILFVLFCLVPFTSSGLVANNITINLICAYASALLLCVLRNIVVVGELIDEDKGAFRSIFGVAFLMAVAPLFAKSAINGSKWAMLVLTCLLVVGVQIGSRVFLLGVVPVLLASFISIYGARIRGRFLYPVLFGIGALLAVSAVQSGIFEQFSEDTRLSEQATLLDFSDTVYSEANSRSADAVDVERRLATRVALDSFQSSPVFGTGYMSTAYYVGLLTKYETVAHGLPTGLLAETGIIGTCLFLLVCFLSIKGYIARIKNSQGNNRTWIRIELITFLTSLFVGLFHQANQDFYLFLLIGGGLAGRQLIGKTSSSR